MLWTTILIALLLSLAAMAYVVWPLVSARVEPYHDEDDRLTELINRKDAVLVAIKELEFDHQVGKISEEDYQRFDARLRRQAVGYMQQLENLAPQVASLDDLLEAEIARQRRTLNGKAAHAVVTPEQAELPPTVAVSNFCTNCGRPLAPGHKFCGHCGTPVASSVAATRG